ncbi:RNA degradosome polyphosphate kinase [Dehalobacterium formicoaceticum]|uniref:Polyphosphate kinase n=1 Tax=Dehalobacterium formicoaceticum TaxID=51515 RepID=A0ABT1Y3Q1_9FIRM|nr:RNA degradosome polyphosphate kinase [Dehalobacterium formicoaceticum]
MSKEHNFINRELSWLEFNHRVLEEAYDPHNPLFERLKFAAIVCSNLDEFFMVRVASLRDQIEAGFNKKDPSGLAPEEEMAAISKRAHRMVQELYQCYHHSIKRGLKKVKIKLLHAKELSEEQNKYLDDFFSKQVFPVLTPMVVDNSRPFPLVMNKSLNIGILVADPKNRKNFHFATVQVPGVLDRLIEIPSPGETRNFILLEELIKNKLDQIFFGYQILATANYRITRNGDYSLDEEGAEDLLAAIEASLRQRKWGSVIRLEVDKNADTRLLEILTEELEITLDEVYLISGPIDLHFLHRIAALKGYDHLLNPPFEPVMHKDFYDVEDIFSVISQKDVLLHHPYHSFEPVLQLIQEAAEDPQVLAIKQTLYRVSGNSPIVDALVQAAENGKQVTVLMEIKARFDEQNNIHWAKKLEKAGCHVIYGLAGLKTHCKVLLIVRSEEEGIKRYVHLGTGNYNDVTARLYSDIGLLTANPYFGADASNLFNMLSGLSQPLEMHRLVVAPSHLRNKIMKFIDRETENAQQGKKAHIIIKINSLTDQNIIEALYNASQAGVKIELIIRGICCLRAGVPGLSDHISVTSIVGRFLEHSRIYYFWADGEEKIYLSSADLMERNLNRRVETLFPIDDEEIKQEVKHILHVTLTDNVKARKLTEQGIYLRPSARGKKVFDSQKIFYQEAQEEVPKKTSRVSQESFHPVTSIKDQVV